jgi:thioredoxin reductase
MEANPANATQNTVDAVEVVVIGGGAGGRSAALVLGRARRRVVIVDAGQPSNRVSTGIGGFLGHDQRPPDEFYAATRVELAKYPTVRWQEGTVAAVRPAPGGGPAWDVALEDGTTLATRFVVLAMGMRYDLPDLPDIGDRWGASVFHCPFCHGWEHRDEPLVMLAGPGREPAEGALLLRNWSDDVTVVAAPGTLTDTDRKVLAAHGVPVVEGEIAHLHGPGRELSSVELADGTVVPARGLLVAAPHRQRTGLVDDLGVALDESGHVVVDAFGRTNLDGVRAVGDLTTPMAQVLHAADTGALAAVGIIREIVAAQL